MSTNPNKKFTPAHALDALKLFEPEFSIARNQPAVAKARTPIDAKASAENAASEGEDHQA
jgi:hypothetical protein